MAAILELFEGQLHDRTVLGFHDQQQWRHAVHGQHLGNIQGS